MSDTSLIAVLVGDKHRALFDNDPVFHAYIYALSMWLRLRVDATAAECAANHVERMRLVERAMHEPMPLFDARNLALRSPAQGDWDGAS